jgi:murein DD-endopeptidase MepM/ murein hydrolase activator NlpD
MDTRLAAGTQASVDWRGASLDRLLTVHEQLERRQRKHWSDWWIHLVLPLAACHLAFFAALRLRPGRTALVLWRWGPPALIAGSVGLLLVALCAGLRGRLAWNVRRLTALACLSSLVGATALFREFPSAYDGRPSPVAMRLPLDGPVTVAWGGRRLSTNYHAASPSERWAYDLLVTRDGRSHEGTGRLVTDYYAYRLPVRSPAAGRVHEVRDGEPDATPGRADRGRGGGNQIVLELGPDQYLVVAHLLAGSIAVSRGMHVDRGEVLGLVGNSGNTSEPHVHVHLQDGPLAATSQGIPFLFTDYLLQATGQRVDRGMPRGGIRRGRFFGDIVRAAD